MSEGRNVMTDQTTPEGELVGRARKGDKKAFEDLVRMYQEPLYRYLCRLSENSEDAMELTQSSFVKAYFSIGRFRGGSSFKTYLFRIASNTWKNTIRDRGRRRNIDIDQVSIASGDNPHEEVVRDQEHKKFWSLVEELPARQKEALTLRIREGYHFDEVAKIMGCTTGSAKASYHRGVEKLKLALKGEDR
ncbi:MAG: sigma-70 family RNA polymerase sigma factor [bacterium]|nr:sigma-70 family RNA polymerase sigma factor [bacterium]